MYFISIKKLIKMYYSTLCIYYNGKDIFFRDDILGESKNPYMLTPACTTDKIVHNNIIYKSKTQYEQYF